MSGAAIEHGKPDVLFHWVLLLLCSAVLGLALVMSVQGGQRVLLPGISAPLPELCTTKRFWGIDCPGCGTTRAFIALAQGDVAMAWAYNPAAIWLFGIMVFQVPYRVVQLVRVHRGGREISLGYFTPAALIVLAVGLVGQWVVRIGGMGF